MKILFICGSLESGKDGVGDYSRRLAGELIRNGHEVQILALNDRSIELVEDTIQEDCGYSIPVLRIPEKLSWSDKLSLSHEYIQSYNPVWISLQFVPYSFHKKGLPLVLASKLHLAVKGYKIHIMFHELWLGIPLNDNLSWKDKIVAVLQKSIIHQLIRKLRPDLITTSIKVYQQALFGQAVSILPLFGNIPLKKVLAERVKEKIIVVHFGTFTSNEADFKNQVNSLNQISKKFQKTLIFKIIGRGGNAKDKMLDIIRAIVNDVTIINLGELSLEEISSCLQSADIGISRANAVLAGKSGSTIAMLEHGLPVLLRGKRAKLDTHLKNCYNKQLFFADDEGIPLEKNDEFGRLPEIAELFVNYLKNK